LQLDPSNCEVTYRQQILPLTPKEYVLLELLMRSPKQVFSPTRIIERLWSSDDLPTEATVRVHIQSLRQKLKQVGAEDLIETQYGLGYRLKPLEVR
jgi:DNA-binding response OmpR family regulator